ncbi:MAG TPA: hypothetical protein VFL99_04590 [Segeticoccus sp.]|uniref:NUDIX hydrolase n=1 Tax=Segeticoccus sp. TaxID=2706531 RepID=UPI002D7FAF98|nr:hypothetical protein [Segeticoccus sp.]HET8599582.1 hypothetical protein [Segeticoccus sp.]
MNLVSAELVAVVATVADGEPLVLASGEPAALPHGPLEPEHRSLQAGMRAWAAEQTGHELGYAEQLYTFADRGRSGAADRSVAISYLALTHRQTDASAWNPWYVHLPWEDRRSATGIALAGQLAEPLRAWAEADPGLAPLRRERVAHAFGLGGDPWRPELALHRYELLWEAGLVAESAPDRGAAGGTAAGAADSERAGSGIPAGDRGRSEVAASGMPMLHDHRRILATGVARLRSMLQYRPVIFELVPEEFTLGQLQTCVEALAGQVVHKQNFRRLVEQQHRLVEPTGAVARNTGGRPARLYRYRSEVFRERRHVGTKLPLPRST